jgi:hypothetical protein
MEMYAVELGKNGADGFKMIESANMLASGREDAERRAVDILKSRGAQLGAKALRIIGAEQQVVWQYP